VCRGKPYNDILISLDYLTATFSIIDPARIHGLGASYGAWMINWIQGHTTRFRCLVAHDGVFDMTTKYYEYVARCLLLGITTRRDTLTRVRALSTMQDR